MAKTGFILERSWAAEDTNRVSITGKNAVLSEFAEVTASSNEIIIYNSNKTAYSGSPTDITTGAVILKGIKYALHVGVNFILKGSGFATTTTALMYVTKYINGPTTLVQIHIHSNASSQTLRLRIDGKEA